MVIFLILEIMETEMEKQRLGRGVGEGGEDRERRSVEFSGQ